MDLEDIGERETLTMSLRDPFALAMYRLVDSTNINSLNFVQEPADLIAYKLLKRELFDTDIERRKVVSPVRLVEPTGFGRLHSEPFRWTNLESALYSVLVAGKAGISYRFDDLTNEIVLNIVPENDRSQETVTNLSTTRIKNQVNLGDRLNLGFYLDSVGSIIQTRLPQVISEVKVEYYPGRPVRRIPATGHYIPIGEDYIRKVTEKSLNAQVGA